MLISREKRRRAQLVVFLILLVWVACIFLDPIRIASWIIPASLLPDQITLYPGKPSAREWNLFYHLGGNGPWIPKVTGVVEDDHTLPQGCVVDQVHMVFPSPPLPFEAKS